MSVEAVESEAQAKKPPKPKPRRTPTDWAVVIMISGTIVFLMVFGTVTALAPRRPFLSVRFAQTAGRLTPTSVVVVPVPGAATVPAGGAAGAATLGGPTVPATPAGPLPGVAGAPAATP